jgi:hypothetical protein
LRPDFGVLSRGMGDSSFIKASFVETLTVAIPVPAG